MKITQEKPPVVFQPVTIVLENLEEVRKVHSAIRAIRADYTCYRNSTACTTIEKALSTVINESAK
jgi:hypothetical protein